MSSCEAVAGFEAEADRSLRKQDLQTEILLKIAG